MDKPRGGPEGSRLPELTKRTILTLLHEASYELEEGPTRPHPDKVRRVKCPTTAFWRFSRRIRRKMIS